MSVNVCGGILLQSVSERKEKEGRDGELKNQEREKKNRPKRSKFNL